MAEQDLEARIKRLEDIEAVKQVHFKYAYHIDTMLYEMVIDLFADDAVAEYSTIGVFKGKEEIAGHAWG